MDYKISKEAYLDIEEIWLFTFKNWSFQQADRYVNLIIDEIEYLSINPESGENCSFIREGYLRSRVKSHFIFYRINHEISEIQIIRILHQRMDFGYQLDQ